MAKRHMKAGGGQPRFTQAQQQEFALHSLAVMKPHLDKFKAARASEVSFAPHIAKQSYVSSHECVKQCQGNDACLSQPNKAIKACDMDTNLSSERYTLNVV